MCLGLLNSSVAVVSVCKERMLLVGFVILVWL